MYIDNVIFGSFSISKIIVVAIATKSATTIVYFSPCLKFILMCASFFSFTHLSSKKWSYLPIRLRPVFLATETSYNLDRLHVL